jgi:uncharacterized membrane-anchored protein YhcB (DUF1043 family)
MFFTGLIIGLLIGVIALFFVIKNNRKKVDKVLDVEQHYQDFIKEKYTKYMEKPKTDKKLDV